MKKKIVIKEEVYSNYKDWIKTIDIIRWEHNFETKEYVIEYKEKG